MTSLTPYNFTQKLGDSYNFELRVEHLKVTLEPHFLPGFLSWKQLQRLVFPLTGLGVELHYASNCEVAWLERTLKSYHTTQKNHDTVMHWCNILMFLDFILPFLDSTYLDTSLPNSGTDCLTTFAQIWLSERLKKNVSRFSARWLAWEIGNCWAMQIIPYLQYRKFK